MEPEMNGFISLNSGGHDKRREVCVGFLSREEVVLYERMKRYSLLARRVQAKYETIYRHFWSSVDLAHNLIDRNIHISPTSEIIETICDCKNCKMARGEKPGKED